MNRGLFLRNAQRLRFLAFKSARQENIMWALFCKGEQVSRAFQAEREAWHHARKSQVITDRRLIEGFEIRQISGGASSV